ncbi:MAG TPA: metal-dependent hydrolase [Bacillota bacterium]|nr:metal-dependent hydrolase [Bacillota bacterium]
MNGTAHAAVGGGAGLVVANTLQTDPTTTIILIGLGGVSALIPDLDTDGKLRGKMTFSYKRFRGIAQFISLLMVGYSYATAQYVGIGLGLFLLGIVSSIRSKHMLTLTGIGVALSGSFFAETWIFLFGIYIFIASVVSHRGYTHSILGVIFFGMIAKKLDLALGINGVFHTCLAGYISHLFLDSRLWPFNKRGIKLFLPISSKEW